MIQITRHDSFLKLQEKAEICGYELWLEKKIYIFGNEKITAQYNVLNLVHFCKTFIFYFMLYLHCSIFICLNGPNPQFITQT